MKTCTCCGYIYDNHDFMELWVRQDRRLQYIPSSPGYNRYWLLLVDCKCGSTIAIEKTYDPRYDMQCPECDGAGTVETYCSTCDGTGIGGPSGCPMCDGAGSEYEPCLMCDSQGSLDRTRMEMAIAVLHQHIAENDLSYSEVLGKI